MPRGAVASAAVMLAWLGWAGVLQAGNTWDGGAATANWSDATNWSPDGAPGYGTLIFSGLVQTTNHNDSITAMNQVNWNGSAAWVMTGSSTLSLFDNGGVQAKLESLGTGGVSINAPITFAATTGAAWGEINAVSSNIAFTGGTLTVNGSAVGGIKLFGGNGLGVSFGGTVNASGKWFAFTNANTQSATIASGASVTMGDFYVMNNGTLNLAGGTLTTSAVRLGGDFGTTGHQNQTLGGTLAITPAAGGVSFGGTINAVSGNTSNALLIHSQNTSGANTLTGGIFLDSDLTIQQAAGGALGTSTGTFDVKARKLTLDAGAGSTVTVGQTLSSTLAAGGSLVKQGSGTVVLSGTSNNYTGTSAGSLNANGTQIAAGTLAIAADTSLGLAPSSAYNNIQFTGSGTLRSNATITLHANRNVSVASGATATFDSNGNTFRINGIVSGGGGNLAATGAGTVTLAANNTYSGTTSVASGTILRVGAGGAAGSVGTGSITNNGEVIFNRTAALTLSNNMTGAGALTKENTNTLSITGTKSFTGATTISAGTLSLGSPSVDGGTEVITYNDGALSPSSSIVNNATLRLARQTATQGTHFGTISGTGDVRVNYGAVTLNASNTYSGKTSILPGSGIANSPSITFNSIADVGGGPSALGAPTTVSAGTIDLGTTSFATSKSVSLIYNGTGHTSDRVLNLSSQDDQVTLSHAGSGLLKFTSNLTATGAGSKTFTLNAVSGATGELAGEIPNNSVTNTTSVSKTGTGTWILSGANTYTGSTSVTQGTLQIGNGGTTGALSTSSNTSISSGATLAFNRSDTVSQGTHFENSLGGAGSIRQDGTGTLVFTGVNSNTGGRIVTAGTMQFGKQTALYNNTPASWTAANLNVKSGATLAFNVGGTGEFTTGDVTTLLTNLAASTSAASGMNAGSFLGFDTSNAAGGSFTLANVIADTTGASGGARGLIKLGTNILDLTGNSTYTGATTISAGTLQVSANNALGTSAGSTTVASGAALRLNNVSYTTAEALAINGTGISGGGALVNSGSSSFAGPITAATNATINAGGGTLTVSGGLVKNGTTLTIAGGGSVIVNGTGISGASANSDLVVDGTTLVVNAASNYNGPTTVQNGGVLVANAAVTTTQMTVDSNSALSGAGSVTTAGGSSYVYLNGAMVVGDSTLGSPVASSFELKSTGAPGSTVMSTASGSALAFDLFQRGGDLSATLSAADFIRPFGIVDASAGGTTLYVSNPVLLSGYAVGDKWTLFDLSNGGSITGSFVLDYSALNLGPGLAASLNHATGVLSIVFIPEPSRATLLMGGLIGVLLRRRRR